MSRRMLALFLVGFLVAPGCAAERSAPSPGASSSAAPTTARAGISGERRVTREASLRLREAHPDATLERARTWFEAHDGFVEQSTSSGAGVDASAGRATYRVASSRYPEALRYVRSLGTVLDSSEQGTDVTAEFVDRSARLVAKRQLEGRLLALVERTGTIADIVKVENELARVRGEIETLEAEERALTSRVELATIHLDVEAPVRPFREDAESLASVLGNAFREGRSIAVGVVRTLVVALTGLSPLLVLAVVALLLHRARKRRTSLALEA